MKSSKTVLSVDPWKTRARITPSVYMLAIFDIASHVRTGKFELESQQGETIPSVYIQSFCHNQTHPRKQSDRNGNRNPTDYAGTSLGGQH